MRPIELLHPLDSCLCGRARLAAFCCHSGGKWSKPPRSISPPSPITGKQLRKCYLSSTSDCCPSISREHYVSDGLLREITKGGTLALEYRVVDRFAKHKAAERSIKSLAACMLCKRHNEAMSPLDSEMLRLLRVLDLWEDEGRHFTCLRSHLFSGQDIERWLLKATIGMFIAKQFPDGHLHPLCIDLLLGRIPWPSGWGLYIDHKQGSTSLDTRDIAVRMIFDEVDRVLVAAQFTLRRRHLTLSLSDPSPPMWGNDYRPEGMFFSKSGFHHEVIFDWNGEDHGSLVIAV